MNNLGVLRFVERPAVGRVVPFAIFMLFVVFGAFWADRLSRYGFDPRWLYAARAMAAGLALLAFWKSYAELRDFNGITPRNLVVATAAGVLVFALWINLDFEWAVFGQARAFDPARADGGIDWILVAFRMFGLAIVVPIVEELFWRSFLLRWVQQHDFLMLDPKKIGQRGNLICALLFASEHNLWFAGLIAGLVYNLIYVRTRNLWLPIISHATTNTALGIWILATGNLKFW